MRQQCLSRLCCISESQRHTSKKGNQSCFKSILKQDGEIKVSSFPLANLWDYRERTFSVVNKQVVNVVRFRKNSFWAGTNYECDLCIGQNAPECAQRRHGHDRVADPIRASHHDSLNTFSLHPCHLQNRSQSVFNTYPRTPAQFTTYACDVGNITQWHRRRCA